jgi:hypothetical protein
MSEDTQVSTFKILPSQFQVAEFAIKQYAVKLPPGTSFDAIRDKPEAWAHIAVNLAEDDIIHVSTKDRAFYARVYVLSVQKQAAKVHVLEYHELPKGEAVPPQYRVEFGGRHKWRVMRNSDNAVMEHGFGSEADAAEHAATLGKKLAA